eukprot:PhF_6_TR41813/c0_g1_i1/m.63424
MSAISSYRLSSSNTSGSGVKPIKLPCGPKGIEMTPVAGFLLDQPNGSGKTLSFLSSSTPQQRNAPSASASSCGGRPTLADMTSPTWLAGYDHGYADGAASAAKSCLLQMQKGGNNSCA